MAIAGFGILYLMGTVSSFGRYTNNLPQLKKQILLLEKENQVNTISYSTTYSEKYQKLIEKIQTAFNKQIDEIKTPLNHITLIKRYIDDHWDIKKIEWGMQSPKYIEYSLLDKVVKHRSQPYFIMDLSLKFKGPQHHANDMFIALLQTPELQQFQLEHKGITQGLYVLRVIEKEKK